MLLAKKPTLATHSEQLSGQRQEWQGVVASNVVGGVEGVERDSLLRHLCVRVKGHASPNIFGMQTGKVPTVVGGTMNTTKYFFVTLAGREVWRQLHQVFGSSRN